MIHWLDHKKSGKFSEKSFVIESGSSSLPGVFWKGSSLSERSPLVLLAHGGSGHKRSEKMVAMGPGSVKDLVGMRFPSMVRHMETVDLFKRVPILSTGKCGSGRMLSERWSKTGIASSMHLLNLIQQTRRELDSGAYRWEPCSEFPMLHPIRESKQRFLENQA